MPTMESESSISSRAEELKCLANEAFKAKKYSQAIDLYSQAIELNNQSAVYWANRSFAHTKLEEYGSAIHDATQAVEIDPKYSKGYYRRGAAYLAMGKFKEALKDFQQVKRICPNDPDAAKKLKECEKAVKKLKFEEAISVPVAERRSIADSVDYRSIVGRMTTSSMLATAAAAVVLAAALMAAKLLSVGAVLAIMALAASIMVIIFPLEQVEPQYSGARIEGDTVTLEFVKQMIEDFKNQQSAP
ncbi:Serine/threonine-protein phosphatase 5 [Bienertia sinuspersici]